MDSWDRDEQIARLERRYVHARTVLSQCRQEYELMCRTPGYAPERLQVMAKRVAELSEQRARLGEKLVTLETMVV